MKTIYAMRVFGYTLLIFCTADLVYNAIFHLWGLLPVNIGGIIASTWGLIINYRTARLARETERINAEIERLRRRL